MILAPILGAVGLTLVTVSHLIPIAMGYQLVPAYIAADPGGQATLAATADTFAAIAPGDQRCRQLPRLRRGRSAVSGGHPHHPCVAAVDRMARFARRRVRWLVGALSPASSVIASISNIGFIGFFVFMLSMGIALLRPLPSRRSNPDICTSTELT
jgi:hypothetical protein